MSIGIEPDAAPPAAAPGSPGEGEHLVAELTRLANALFHGRGSIGGGGASTTQSAPATPGFLSSPPLASSPPLKESDLRSLGTLLAEHSPGDAPRFAEASPALPSSADSTPYFLTIAGPPTANNLPQQGDLPSTAPPAPPALTASPPVSAPPALTASPAVSAPPAPLAPTASPAVPPPPAPPALTASPPVSAPPAPLAPTASPAVPPPPAPLAPTASPAVPPPPGSTDFEPQLFAYAVEPVPVPAQTSGAFDPYTVKRDFPILRERVQGRELVWLDNAATTQKPRAVIERLTYYYEHENSNIHRAAHTLAARATDAYEAARDKVRRFINAPSAKEIVFVRGATEGINLVAQSWGRKYVGAGDEIVITWLEHHANIVPWQQLAQEKGAKLRVAPVDSRGQVILEEYERLLGSRTKLVAITQVSNALGTIVPVEEMTRIAHRYGACVLVDGAQAISHMRVDVQALDADFYVFSGHKVFAPTGIGVVFGKAAVLEHMPPWQGGGNMIQDVTFERTLYQPPPSRFEAGTGNIADAVGLGAALDYVTALGIENIGRHEHELLEYGTERLLEVPGLTLIGTAAEKAGVLSFVLDGQRTEDVGGMLDQEGIAVRSGHHCAQPILRRFGLESTVRASLAPYNTREDLDRLVTALQRIQAGRPRR